MKRYRLSDICLAIQADETVDLRRKTAAGIILGDIGIVKDETFAQRCQAMSYSMEVAFALPYVAIGTPRKRRLEMLSNAAVELARYYKIEPVEADL